MSAQPFGAALLPKQPHHVSVYGRYPGSGRVRENAPEFDCLPKTFVSVTGRTALGTERHNRFHHPLLFRGKRRIFTSFPFNLR
jgi:hypothetical protein